MSKERENLFSILMPPPKAQLPVMDVIRTTYGPIPIQVDESLPEGTAEFRDPLTGRVVGRITNIG